MRTLWIYLLMKQDLFCSCVCIFHQKAMEHKIEVVLYLKGSSEALEFHLLVLSVCGFVESQCIDITIFTLFWKEAIYIGQAVQCC